MLKYLILLLFSFYSCANKKLFNNSSEKLDLSIIFNADILSLNLKDRYLKYSNILSNKKYSSIDPWIDYKFQDFNCMTYIETISALVLSKNIKEFDQNIDRIVYNSKSRNLENRNHFMYADHIKNNHHLYQDITTKIVKNKKYLKNNQASINRSLFLKKVYDLNIDAQNEIISFKSIDIGRIKFLKNDILKNLKYDKFYIVLLVPNNSFQQKISPKIGTNLDIKHAGILFLDKNNHLIFRHYSLKTKSSQDIEIEEYLESHKDYFDSLLFIKIKDENIV